MCTCDTGKKFLQIRITRHSVFSPFIIGSFIIVILELSGRRKKTIVKWIILCICSFLNSSLWKLGDFISGA